MRPHCLTIFLLFGLSFATGQVSDFVFEESEWRVWGCCNPVSTTTYYFQGDTVLDQVNYTKAYVSWDTIIGNSDDSYYGVIRQADGLVFWRFGDTEHILYDYNLAPGDTFFVHPWIHVSEGQIVTAVYDSTVLDVQRQVIRFATPALGWRSEIWIEGIGSIYGIFETGNHPGFDIEYALLCVSTNDSLVFFNPQFTTCFQSTVSSKYIEPTPTIEISPNPVVDNILLHGALDLAGQVFQIFSVDGVLLASGIVEENRISAERIPNGIYYLFIGQNLPYIAKFVKYAR